MTKVVAGVALAFVVGTAVVAGWWRTTGGRWFDITSPSMGAAAPVGTLLLSRPVTVSHLHVGQIIAFHPPGRAVTYTHRIVTITGGAIRTKGDINGSVDSWTLHQQNLIGVVVARWWTAGWLLRSAPLLVLGAVVVLGATTLLRPSRRLPARIVLLALVVSICISVYKPLVRAETLVTAPFAGGAQTTLVSTGILPVRLDATKGTSVHLTDGHVGQVMTRTTAKKGFYHFDVRAALGLWWWIAVIGVCLIPLLIGLAVGLPPRDPAT